MKKLILVTLLAVAAASLLSETRRSGEENEARAVALDKFHRQYDGVDPRRQVILDNGLTAVLPAEPSDPPPVKAKRRGGEPSKARRVSQTQPPAAPAPPVVKTAPPWIPKSEAEELAASKPDDSGSRVLVGRLSSSEARARQDLQQTVERAVADWLAADVPTSWKVPASVIGSMTQGSYTQQVTRNLTPKNLEAEAAEATSKAEIPGLDNLYTLHRAWRKLDFSPSKRASILKLYRKDLASGRMHRLGGGLALALVGLAVLSGYIKADEATKGYYTNRLRLVAAAGLGAAGVVAYRYLV